MQTVFQDCLDTYGCPPILRPHPGAVYAPFVEITVQGERVLTVGNDSSPPVKNHAMITSFQYGTSTGSGGCGMKIEVTDEGGRLFEKFAQAVNKDITKVQSRITGIQGCKAEFGWYLKRCLDGSVTKVTNVENAPVPELAQYVHFLPTNVDVNFNDGVIKFIFEGVDLFLRSFEARLEQPMSPEDQKISLDEGLRKVFLQKDPEFTDLRYRTWNMKPSGPFWKFGGKPGHKSTHPTDQESNVSCARKWIMQNRTENDLGVLVVYEPGEAFSPPGCIVIQEDPRGPSLKPDCCQNSIGTYVVNGGNESPVITFNPTIKWPLVGNSGDGGVPAGATSGQSNRKANEKLQVDVQNTGRQFTPNSSQDNWMHQPPENHAPMMLFNSTVHNGASKPYEAMVSAIEAELKVMGDPSYVNPVMMTGKFLSLVVIDPYYFEGGSTWDAPGDWIEKPTCNPILSNKRWLILGVDHQITSGQYFTTFKLKLDVPNVDIAADETFGGCGTEKPKESTSKDPRK